MKENPGSQPGEPSRRPRRGKIASRHWRCSGKMLGCWDAGKRLLLLLMLELLLKLLGRECDLLIALHPSASAGLLQPGCFSRVWLSLLHQSACDGILISRQAVGRQVQGDFARGRISDLAGVGEGSVDVLSKLDV